MSGVGEEVEGTVVPEKEFKYSTINLETASANVTTMSEDVKASANPDKQTERSVEAEVLY